MTQQHDTLTFAVGTVTADQALMYTQQFISTSGYTDPEHIDANHDTLIAMGLGLLEDCPPWSRADHLNAIRGRLGRSLSNREMRELARLYKVSAKRLANNSTTGKQWPPERRWATENVGYSHHELLNGLPEDRQDALIELADASGWSCDELAAHCFGRGSEGVQPSIPVGGKHEPSIYAGIPDDDSAADDDDPPYADNAQYKDYAMTLPAAYDFTDYIAVPRNPVDAANVLREQFTGAELATLVAELVR